MDILVLNIKERLELLYFDAVSNTISSGKSSTTAMAGSTESEQF